LLFFPLFFSFEFKFFDSRSSSAMPRSLLRAAPFLLASARAWAAPACGAFSINARVAVHEVAPYFASFNIDSSADRSFFLLDWRAPALAAAARGVAAAGGAGLVRFGGTGNNFLVYDAPGAPPCVRSAAAPRRECLNASTWAGVAGVAAAAAAPVVFGVNMFPRGDEKANHTFDPTNAAAFFAAARARGDAIWGVECGNELGPDGVLSPAEQAAGLLALDDALAEVYGAAPRPFLVGPDALGFHAPAPSPPGFVPSADVLAYMADFVAAMRGRLRAVTHHEYIEINETAVLDPAFLDLTAEIAAQVVARVRAVDARVEIWAGEIGPHNGDGGPGDGRPGNCAGNVVCGRWGSAMWYADAMAAKARAGYAAFCRQDLIGADYGLLNVTTLAPTPDYWVLALWRRTVGTRVLAVDAPPADARVRVGAFCGAAPRTATLVVVNLADAPACLAPPGLADPLAPRREYALAPAGGGGVAAARAALNGGPPLALAGGALPPLPPALVPAALPIQLPPLGVVFVNFDTDADACGGPPAAE